MTTARDVILGPLTDRFFLIEAKPIADEILAALLSAPEPVRLELARKLNPWRPIETAPRDANDDEAWYFGGYWDGGYGLIQWTQDGWRDTEWNKTSPTYWLPLPAPPSEDKPI